MKMNITEGSAGSKSEFKEFKQYLKISRRSVCECIAIIEIASRTTVALVLLKGHLCRLWIHQLEIKLVRQHTVKGAEILSPIKQLKEIIPAVKYHQEFYDGSGYPEGLKGDAIPLFARIIGIADAIDAMSADRPYRKGKTMDAVVEELKRCSGTQFDPKVADVFVKMAEGGKL
jgi:hypothetical protein